LLTEEEFKRLDYQVMHHAFASHNQLGRLCDEAVYHNDLASRLEARDLGPVRKKVPVTVSYREFRKMYYLDLVVGDSAIYELNSVVRNLRLAREGIALGTQRVHLTADNVGFKLTALTDPADHAESHLRRFLALTGLHALHWINFNHHRIEFVTLVQ